MLLYPGFSICHKEGYAPSCAALRLFNAEASLFAGHGAPGMRASVVMVCGLSTCSAWDYTLLCSTWNLPRLGIEPVASEFLTTGPPEVLASVF